MKSTACLIALAASILFSSFTPTASADSYRISGIITDVGKNTFTVRTRGDRVEVSYNKDTRIKGKLRRGNRVTVEYRMIARKVETW